VIAFDEGLLPQSFTHVAVYVPAPTLIVLVVSEVLHLIVPDVHALAVNVTFSVPHTGPVLPVIVGAVGVTPVPMVIAAEANEVPHAFVQVAV